MRDHTRLDTLTVASELSPAAPQESPTNISCMPTVIGRASRSRHGAEHRAGRLVRHCEERSDEAIQILSADEVGSLRFARNDDATPRSPRDAAASPAPSAISSSQNIRASSRADSVANRLRRINSASVASESDSQSGEHALDHLPAQPRGGRHAVGKTDLVADFERDAEGGEGGFRQARAL